jgi:lipopolysaccharide transport system ATP-binding protein
MRFYLADGAGRQLPAQISANTDVWVTVEGRIETIDPAMLVGYAAFARNGQLLFWSYNRDEAESYWQPLGTGYCRLRSRIPARLLNQGSYRLELAVNFYCREWISRPGKNSPAIHFEIAGGASDSPYWYTYGRDGFLAPIFHWEVVQKEQTWASESQSRHRGLGT